MQHVAVEERLDEFSRRDVLVTPGAPTPILATRRRVTGVNGQLTQKRPKVLPLQLASTAN
jgi:hypothetical protein